MAKAGARVVSGLVENVVAAAVPQAVNDWGGKNGGALGLGTGALLLVAGGLGWAFGGRGLKPHAEQVTRGALAWGATIGTSQADAAIKAASAKTTSGTTSSSTSAAALVEAQMAAMQAQAASVNLVASLPPVPGTRTEIYQPSSLEGMA
jgi:hypothetical protein